MNTPPEAVAYRTLMQHPPFRPDGLMVDLKTRQLPSGPETYLALHAKNGDILLFLRVDWEQNAVTLAKCRGGEWLDKIALQNSPDPDSTKISLSIRPGVVTITNDGKRLADWPLDAALADISSLHGSGPWELDLSSAHSIKPPPEVLPNLPLDNKLLRTFQPDLIFDFGMHNGDDTDFYLRKGFRVVAVEANPTLCALGAMRFKEALNSKHLIICNIGVAPVRGELSFYINHDLSEWSSFDREIASRGHPVTEVRVATARPEDFFTAFGIPYYCKIDIEGLDRLVIDAIASLEVKPRYVSFENAATRDFEALAAAGYTSFQLVEQSGVPRIRLPAPSLEGKTIGHEFPAGSSGPFGMDLPGSWMNVTETRAALNEHSATSAEQTAREHKWWDLHAAART
jgi:FkbM family methyltransferase